MVKLQAWALSHLLPCAGASAGPARPLSPALLAFAAHFTSQEPFPVDWYHLLDGVFFLGVVRFGSKLKIRQANFIKLVHSAFKELVSSHRSIIILLAGRHI